MEKRSFCKKVHELFRHQWTNRQKNRKVRLETPPETSRKWKKKSQKEFPLNFEKYLKNLRSWKFSHVRRKLTFDVLNWFRNPPCQFNLSFSKIDRRFLRENVWAKCPMYKKSPCIGFLVLVVRSGWLEQERYSLDLEKRRWCRRCNWSMIGLVVWNRRNIVLGLRWVAILQLGSKSWSKLFLWIDRSAFEKSLKTQNKTTTKFENPKISQTFFKKWWLFSFPTFFSILSVSPTHCTILLVQPTYLEH